MNAATTAPERTALAHALDSNSVTFKSETQGFFIRCEVEPDDDTVYIEKLFISVDGVEHDCFDNIDKSARNCIQNEARDAYREKCGDRAESYAIDRAMA